MDLDLHRISRMLQSKLGEELRKEQFLFEPEAILLNHGSYGSVPKCVMDARKHIQDIVERSPDDWYRRKLPYYHKQSLKALCPFIGAKEQNTVFVENVTEGMNVVCRSLPWEADDSILVSNLTYHSVFIFAKECAKLVKVELTFPIESNQQIVDKYETVLKSNPNIKLAIIAHITSPTSVRMPIKELCELCHSYNVKVLIDGAHTVGQIPLNLEDIGADFYAGNVHKWLFTPRGCGYLWIAPVHHSIIRPVVISHFHGVKLHYDFCIRGSRDDSPYHTVSRAIEFQQDLGGLSAITDYNTTLLEHAIRDLVTAWDTHRLPINPALEAPFMKLIKVPDMNNYDKTSIGGGDLETDLYTRYNIQSLCMIVQGDLYIRLSAHVYNTTKDYQCLRDAVLELAKEPRQEKPPKAYGLPIMHWDLSPFA